MNFCSNFRGEKIFLKTGSIFFALSIFLYLLKFFYWLWNFFSLFFAPNFNFFHTFFFCIVEFFSLLWFFVFLLGGFLNFSLIFYDTKKPRKFVKFCHEMNLKKKFPKNSHVSSIKTKKKSPRKSRKHFCVSFDLDTFSFRQQYTKSVFNFLFCWHLKKKNANVVKKNWEHKKI